MAASPLAHTVMVFAIGSPNTGRYILLHSFPSLLYPVFLGLLPAVAAMSSQDVSGKAHHSRR